MGMELPIFSDFSTGLELGGTAAAGNINPSIGVMISADLTNKRAKLEWRTAATNNNAYFFTLMYSIL
jgi:hypothetical protein